MPASSIYIHLPFCKTKCPYCDFASFAKEDDKRQRYIDALCSEIDQRMLQWDLRDVEIKTIFFGGGTPSVHSRAELEQIFSKLKQWFKILNSAEITLEANPGTIDRAKLEQFIELGINRISFGAQSFDPDLLEKLGRGHSVEDSIRFASVLNRHCKEERRSNPVDQQSLSTGLLHCVRNDGRLASWSLDLIYGLPGQSLESWQQSLEQALEFSPPHISAYCLSIEANTPYGKIYGDSSHQDLPQETKLIEMYELANEKFKAAGLERYEISNWAKPGHEARHNLVYWRGQEYFAFGLSAHGYIDSLRYANTREFEQYLAGIFEQESSKIGTQEKLEEKILLGLRLAEGLSLNQELNAAINQAKLQELKNTGFIEGQNLIKLSDKAQLVSNRVIAELCYH